jgi:hypothetical protein
VVVWRAVSTVGVMLDPTWGGIMLGELALRQPPQAQVGAEYDGPARCCALIQRQNCARPAHGFPLPGSDPLARRGVKPLASNANEESRGHVRGV